MDPSAQAPQPALTFNRAYQGTAGLRSAGSVLIEYQAHCTWHLPAENASNAKILPIFDGMSEIQRLLIGRTVTRLNVR